MYHLDLVRLVKAHNNFDGLFLERVRQLSLVDFVFDFNHNQKLLLSLNNRAPFLTFNPRLAEFPSGGSLHSFAVDLRRFLGGRLNKIKVINNDTILHLEFLVRNNVLDLEVLHLFIELIPSHPQVVLTNSDSKILTAFRYNDERGRDGRLIRRGLIYELPHSPLKDQRENAANHDYLTPYLSMYAEVIKKQNYREIYTYIEHNLKKLIRLKNNFIADINRGDNLQEMYDQATLLLTYKPLITAKTVDVEGVEIKVDPKYDALYNAELLFKKAKKIKKGVHILTAKIKEIDTQISYLKALDNQLYFMSDPEDISAVYRELNLGKITGKKEVIKALEPYYIMVKNTIILFGKNNKQNDHLTFTIANKIDTFVHIKGAPGSHIIIRSESPTKEELETAGLLALYLSRKVDGTISYTPIREIKKGLYPGQVIMQSEKTFFLRYDDNFTTDYVSSVQRFTKNHRP